MQKIQMNILASWIFIFLNIFFNNFEIAVEI